MGKKMPADPIKRIDDIHYIQAYIKAQNKTHSHRNYILFILGITTGYRVGDLVTLRVKDIKRALSYGYFQIEEGKTKKIRKVPIVSNLKKELKDYIKNKKYERNREMAYELMSEEGVYDQETDNPLNITDEEYNELYNIIIEDIQLKAIKDIKNELHVINNNLISVDKHLSIIKGIMIFMLIVSIVLGVISGCSLSSLI